MSSSKAIQASLIGGTIHNTGIFSLLLSTSVFKYPHRMLRHWTNGLAFLFTDDVAKEGYPKFQLDQASPQQELTGVNQNLFVAPSRIGIRWTLMIDLAVAFR